jgi:hypothetical protein
MELNKITLVGWVDQALKQSLKKKSSLSLGLHVYGFSTLEQWLARFDLERCTLKQISMIKELN